MASGGVASSRMNLAAWGIGEWLSSNRASFLGSCDIEWLIARDICKVSSKISVIYVGSSSVKAKIVFDATSALFPHDSTATVAVETGILGFKSACSVK